MFDKACVQHINELAKPLQEARTTLVFTTCVLFFAYTLHL